MRTRIGLALILPAPLHRSPARYRAASRARASRRAPWRPYDAAPAELLGPSAHRSYADPSPAFSGDAAPVVGDLQVEHAGRLAERFAGMLDRGYPVGLTGAILQEVVQGVATTSEFEQVSEYLGSQPFYHPLDPIETHREAARIYFRCRRAGITIRGSIDCLIARVAIEHDLFLLHDDREFERIAEVVPELKLA